MAVSKSGQTEQAIVGAHALVLAAGSKRRAEVMLQPRRAGVEIADGENKVIGLDHRNPQVFGFRCTCP